MKWSEVKELMIKDGAVLVMDALYFFIKILDRVQKTETTDIKVFKVKTKNYHVRLLIDNSFDSPAILARRKGLLKDWSFIEKKDVPECLVQDIFESSCSPAKRKKLIDKMMGLKAFW